MVVIYSLSFLLLAWLVFVPGLWYHRFNTERPGNRSCVSCLPPNNIPGWGSFSLSTSGRGGSQCRIATCLDKQCCNVRGSSLEELCKPVDHGMPYALHHCPWLWDLETIAVTTGTRPPADYLDMDML